MTSEALDLLDRLTDPELAKQAEIDNARPRDRSPLRYFRADVPEQIPEAQQKQVGNFQQWGFYLDVDVKEVYSSNPPVEPGMVQLWIRCPNPRRQDGTENKANVNSESTLMLGSAGIKLRGLLGAKNVVFKEEVHPWTSRSQTDKPDPNRPGQMLWEDRENNTFYYKLELGAPASSNGSAPTPVSAEPSQEAVAAALKLLEGNGMEETAFNLAASKDPIIKKDTAMVSAIASGKFAADQIATGKIVRDGSLLVVV